MRQTQQSSLAKSASKAHIQNQSDIEEKMTSKQFSTGRAWDPK